LKAYLYKPSICEAAMDIDLLRSEIDVLDRILLDILELRARCALEIGRMKAKEGLPVYCSEREEMILKRVRDMNRGPLSDEAVERIFRRIIEEVRSLQEERAYSNREGFLDDSSS